MRSIVDNTTTPNITTKRQRTSPTTTMTNGTWFETVWFSSENRRTGILNQKRIMTDPEFYFLNHKNQPVKPSKRNEKTEESHLMSFKDFIYWLALTDVAKNPHFAPQTKMCKPCQNFNFMIKVSCLLTVLIDFSRSLFLRLDWTPLDLKKRRFYKLHQQSEVAFEL